MPAFAGWIPTITGRLSFSRFGEAATGRSVVANLSTTPTNWIFGIQRRVSRDGPFWPWLNETLLKRFPNTDYVLFLRVSDGMLPYPKASCGDADVTEADMVLRPDDRSELAGRVYFVNGHNRVFKQMVQKGIDDVRDLAASSQYDVGNAVPASGGYFERALARTSEIWESLAAAARSGEEVPNFGWAEVLIRRTGECRIHVAPQALFTTERIIEAQGADNAVAAWEAAADEVALEAESVAEQCFCMLRDLAHKHYHHNEAADLLTTVHTWAEAEDVKWRRETQYGLLRMAISVRRDGRADNFRQTLGLIAYADAFQKHMCSWFMADHRDIKKSLLRFDYDFTSLKTSVEASLKAREIKDTNLRARLFFVFATCVTTVGLLLPGLRQARLGKELSGAAEAFLVLIDLGISNPWFGIFVAGVLALAFDVAVLQLTTRPQFLNPFAASLERFSQGLLADFRRHGEQPISHTAAVILVGLFVGLSSSLTYGLMWLGYKLFSIAFGW